MTLNFTIQGTIKNFANSGPCYVVNTNFAGLCQFPLHQMISTLTITLNNQAVTIRPSQIIDKFLHYNFDRKSQKSTFSSTPCYPDQANLYEVSSGHITGEFADYRDSVDHISRQCVPITYTANPILGATGANGTAQFSVTICEPLMINPLIFDRHWWKKPGLTQITTFGINMTFDPTGLARIWRQATDDPTQYNNISVSINQPSISLAYFTLPTYMSIPPSISFPYTAVQNYVYNFNNPIAPNAQYTVTSNTIQFQSIPHRLIIGVSKQVNTRTFNDTDSFLPITNVNITWNNTTGILSTLTQYDLWLISEKNGLKDSSNHGLCSVVKQSMFMALHLIQANHTINLFTAHQLLSLSNLEAISSFLTKTIQANKALGISKSKYKVSTIHLTMFNHNSTLSFYIMGQ
jgi:hypothetical protein